MALFDTCQNLQMTKTMTMFVIALLCPYPSGLYPSNRNSEMCKQLSHCSVQPFYPTLLILICSHQIFIRGGQLRQIGGDFYKGYAPSGDGKQRGFQLYPRLMLVGCCGNRFASFLLDERQKCPALISAPPSSTEQRISRLREDKVIL